MREPLPRVSARSLAVLLLVGASLIGLVGAVRAGRESAQTLYEQALRLRHENACRRVEAELSKDDGFYLVLDPEKRSLSLKLGGALLRELSLESIEVGRPHRFFIERRTAQSVRGRRHRDGRLSPPRPLLRLPIEIPESPDEETPTVMLPPEPETAIAVPRRFFLRYESGVVLEFRPGRAERALSQRIADGFSTLLGEPEVRLHLILDSLAAEAFYRSVPPETDLLVL